MTQPTPGPTLRIVHGGEPSEEELAALVVAVSTVASRDEVEAAPTGRWVAGGRAGSSWRANGWLDAARRSALRAR